MMLELLQAFRNNFPDEFFVLLSKDSKDVIDSYVVLPLFYQTPNAVSYRSDLMPLDSSIVGTMHSHPSGYAIPSDADLSTFHRFGNIHLIVGYPYSLENIRAYNKKGEPLKDIKFI